jgi:hypothetical protein
VPIDLGDDDRTQCRRAQVRDMERADRTVALNEGKYGGFGRDLVLAVSGFAADVGFVGLNDLVLTAESTPASCLRALPRGCGAS